MMWPIGEISNNGSTDRDVICLGRPPRTATYPILIPLLTSPVGLMSGGLTTTPQILIQAQASPGASSEIIDELSHVEAFVQAIRERSAELPRESGMSHPIDRLISDLFEAHPLHAQHWFAMAFYRLTPEPSVLADFLQGIAASDRRLFGNTGLNLAVGALYHSSVAVREAGIRILEAWEASELASVLASLAGTEKLRWLAEYMRQVARDLAT